MFILGEVINKNTSPFFKNKGVGFSVVGKQNTIKHSNFGATVARGFLL